MWYRLIPEKPISLLLWHHLLARLPIYGSFISVFCMVFFFLLTITVHSGPSVRIYLRCSVRGQSAHDLFFIFSTFSDIRSSFNFFSDPFSICLLIFLFFLLFLSSVSLLGWGSALVPSTLAGILINDCY